MTHASLEYEKLVKDLHEALLHADGVQTIDVRHNVKVKGKSGATHQIDVYWEFKLAGVTYKTCIECKHYGTKIKKTNIAAFATIIEDIGNANGIFVTTMGYQEGAMQLAKSKGIRLLLVNHLLKTVSIVSRFTAPITEVTGIKYNRKQARSALEKLGLNNYALTTRWSNHTIFYDQFGAYTTTLKEFFSNKTSSEGRFKISKPGLYDMTDIGLLEIEELEYKITIQRGEHQMDIPLNETERAIVEDVLENTVCYLRDDGSVTEFQEAKRNAV